MKVLKKKDEKIITCECGAKLEYDNNDIEYLELGIAMVKCPLCNRYIQLDNEEPLTLDENNIEFPKHFYKFGTNFGAVSVSDEEIEKSVKNVVCALKEGQEYATTGYGNFCAIGLDRGEDGYEIIVCKDYYSVNVDRK